MSAGLCMWSPSGHLILCNERYVQMYNLTAEVTRPVALRDLLLHRIRMGNFPGDPDRISPNLLATIAKGKTVTSMLENEGRSLRSPTADARRRLVATHEDVTEQRKSRG